MPSQWNHFCIPFVGLNIPLLYKRDSDALKRTPQTPSIEEGKEPEPERA